MNSQNENDIDTLTQIKEIIYNFLIFNFDFDKNKENKTKRTTTTTNKKMKSISKKNIFEVKQFLSEKKYAV